MTRYLPPNLLALFTPRDSVEYVPPVEKRKMPPYSGIALYVKNFEDPKENPPPPPPQILNREERKQKKRQERLEQELEKINEALKTWDPHKNPKATDEAYKTLFVARISYQTSEHKLKREFEQYGPIKSVRMVYDNEGKPRGYAFIEFEKERDMRTAYKEADGKRIDGRRVLVDVERGRTVKGWKPRRFAGGLGGTRSAPESRRERRDDREERENRGSKRPREERNDYRKDDRERRGEERRGEERKGEERRGEEKRDDKRGEERRGEERRDDKRGEERRGEERRERERDYYYRDEERSQRRRYR